MSMFDGSVSTERDRFRAEMASEQPIMNIEAVAATLHMIAASNAISSDTQLIEFLHFLAGTIDDECQAKRRKLYNGSRIDS